MGSYSRQPAIRVFFSIGGGIVVANGFNINPKFAFLGLLTTGFISFLFVRQKLLYQFKYKLVGGVIYLMTLFISGVLISSQGKNKTVHYDKELSVASSAYILARTTSSLRWNKRWNAAVVEVIAINQNGKWVPQHFNLMTVFEKKGENFHYPDYLILKTKLETLQQPLNPGQFDYASYMHGKGVYYRCFVNQSSYFKIDNLDDVRFSDFPMLLRNSLELKLTAFEFSNRNLGFLFALILGDRGMLASEDLQSFKNTGVIHLMAVSGMHVGTIYFALLLILRPLNRISNGAYLRFTLTIVSLWFYGCITGLSPSVVRSCLMVSLVSIGNTFRLRIRTLNIIASSALIIILFQPDFLKDVGFQLSYMAVLGIILIHPIFCNMLTSRIWLVDKIWSLACVSLAAQIATFPIAVHYFHQFPVYFLLANLLLIPLVIIIFYGGLLLLCLSWMDGWFSEVISKILNFLVQITFDMAEWTAQLPYAVIDDIRLSEIETVLIYGIIAFVLALINSRKLSYVLVVGFFIICFLTSRCLWLVDINKQNHILIYTSEKGSLIDFIYHRNRYLYQDSIFHEKSELRSKIIGSYNIDFGLRKNLNSDQQVKKPIFIKTINQTTFFEYRNVRMAVIKGFFKAELSPISLNYTLIGSSFKGDLLKVLRSFHADTLIFESGIPTNKLEEWENECRRRDMPFISMKEKGFIKIQIE